MNLFTIVFTKKNAERFFGLLKESGVRRIVDVRLNKRFAACRFRQAGRSSIFSEADLRNRLCPHARTRSDT